MDYGGGLNKPCTCIGKGLKPFPNQKGIIYQPCHLWHGRKVRTNFWDFSPLICSMFKTLLKRMGREINPPNATS